jgi:hypothetical protein
MVFYPNPSNVGTNQVSSLGDGYTINVTWFPAEHSAPKNKIAYQIYYSIVKETVFAEGPKLVSIDGATSANIIDLTPGQDYFIAVRPVEYDPTIFDLTLLPIAHDNLRFYPHSILRHDMTAADLVVPLLDVEGFPDAGVVKVGVELIRYLAIDHVNNNLVVPAGGGGAQPVRLVDQGGGNFFTASPSNVGHGSVTNLTAVSGSGGPTETWTIKCVFVQRDMSNNPMPGTAQFIAIGTVSGQKLDVHGNPFVWTANGMVVSNGILSFSITETAPPFRPGDLFTIKVAGAVAGAASGRGYNNSTATLHTVGGSDGLNTWDPTVPLFTVGEDSRWDLIYICQSRFEYPHFPFTMVDGYHQVAKDLLSTDLSAADAANVTFPAFDFAGYHRTDPVQLLNGTCVGSYIGGEMGCIDGYGNVQILRGFSLQDQNTQRQDVLLSVTGKPAVLIKRVQTGITCNCYLPSSEHPDDRCPFCYGTKFVFGYEQYFNPRRSDGRILVRPGPTEESLKRYEAGMESEFPLDLWTLTVPTIKMRDIIVMFDQDDNEEFRYEVAGVIRNNTINGLDGGQHFKVIRIRKFDPAYQIRIFRNTADFPSKLNTSIGFVPGIPPHTHEIVINEKIMSVNQINQTTAVSQGHNHPIVNGQVMEALGHTHTIILP